MPRGTVLEVFRYPVKSMAGERPDAIQVGEHGVEGDRRFAVWQRRGRRLSARAAPKMLAWSATLDGGSEPRIFGPDGSEHRWDDELEVALRESIAKDVALVRDPQGLQDVQGTLLITVEATRRQLEEELGGELDIRRFRPNLHLDLDTEPFEESAWPEGTRLRVGEVELVLDHPCDRCAITIHDPEQREAPRPEVLKQINERHETFFGFRARALGPGRVAVGDPVEVERP